MKIGTFMVDDGPTYGLVLGDRWLDISAAAEIFDGLDAGSHLLDFVAGGETSLAWGNRLQSAAVLEPERFDGAWHPLRGAQFLPPFFPGGRLFTQRGNSCLFSRSVNLTLPEHPVWERRYTTNLVGHNTVSDCVGSGWNPEFVAVIGQGGRDIPPEKVRDHIFGYTMMIDHPGASRPVFFDDWGMAAHQDEMVFRDHMAVGAFFGNSLPPHPVGPWIVTRDEIPDPYDLWITGEENYGQTRLIEKVSSGASLFRFEDTFSFMSRLLTLKPGDMLSSASIGYDGYATQEETPPGSWLQTTCEKIGSLRLYLSPLTPGDQE
jgi:2-keto-4-pentenoate hydratase/2-oxohepta-3-ene-1,7-dioic acid hydratase in catechol pathway